MLAILFKVVVCCRRVPALEFPLVFVWFVCFFLFGGRLFSMCVDVLFDLNVSCGCVFFVFVFVVWGTLLTSVACLVTFCCFALAILFKVVICCRCVLLWSFPWCLYGLFVLIFGERLFSRFVDVLFGLNVLWLFVLCF